MVIINLSIHNKGCIRLQIVPAIDDVPGPHDVSSSPILGSWRPGEHILMTNILTLLLCNDFVVRFFSQLDWTVMCMDGLLRRREGWT